MLAPNHERRRFTVDEVARMVDAGVLGEDEPLELIEGELIVVPPQGPEHAERVTRLNMLLAPRYVGRADVRVQCPLDLDAINQPEPDLAVVRPTPGRHPRGADVLVVIGRAGRGAPGVDAARAGLTRSRSGRAATIRGPPWPCLRPLPTHRPGSAASSRSSSSTTATPRSTACASSRS